MRVWVVGTVAWLLAGAAIGAEVAQDTYLAGRVMSIIDGDTFDLLAQDGTEHRIRPTGFDTPERGRACFSECTEALRQMIDGKVVEARCYKLQPSAGKHRARDVCRVTLDGKDIGLQMISAGAAWHAKKWGFEQTTAERHAYAEAEAVARVGKLGCLWKDF